MGESAGRRAAEVAAVRTALEMGYRLVDTAEMYGEGGAEEIVGEALAAALRAGSVARDDLFIVSKVYPQNASVRGTVAACERSLKRLGLEHLDGYLLHWPGSVPLAETVDAFELLRARGRIRHWGVSNFDRADIDALMRVPGGERCAINQIYYSLSTRGPAFDLVPRLQSQSIVTMAYSPIDQGVLARNAALAALARRRGATAAQVALAWLIAQQGVMAIPKAVSEAHLRENFAAQTIALDEAEHTELDKAFPPPRRKTPLAMI
jgi:diketogulonate reductase-like aldo/keto reductase